MVTHLTGRAETRSQSTQLNCAQKATAAQSPTNSLLAANQQSRQLQELLQCQLCELVATNYKTGVANVKEVVRTAIWRKVILHHLRR
jgi:hypothetical protein